MAVTPTMLALCIVLLTLGKTRAFLLPNGGVNSTFSSSDRSYHELVSLIVDEKESRHQLENRVSDLASRLDQMDQLHQQVWIQLDKDKNTRETLLQKFVAIDQQLRNLTATTNHLISDSAVDKDGMNRLQENISSIAEHMERVQHKFENETANLNAVMNQLVNKNNDIGFNVSELEKELQAGIDWMNTTGRKSNTPVIGFCVTTPNKSSTDLLRFTVSIYNSGHIYNLTTGKVTIRIPGVYFFTATIVREPGVKQAYCCFGVNDIYLDNECTVGYGSNNVGYPSGTLSLLYHFNAGDTAKLYGCDGAGHMNDNSMLVGFLVHEDDV